MKNLFSYLLLLLLSFAGSDAFAQNSILAGKITDEHDKPIAGARIKVSDGLDMVTEVVADDEGLYNTQLLQSRTYNIAISANGKYLKAKKIFLKPCDKTEWYYNFQVAGGKLEETVTERDPFMAAKLAQIEEDQKFMDFGGAKETYITNIATPDQKNAGGVATYKEHYIIRAKDTGSKPAKDMTKPDGLK